jgi:hypothetical protein
MINLNRLYYLKNKPKIISFFGVHYDQNRKVEFNIPYPFVEI